jgi:quinol monooxygenase YgiN
MTAHWFMPVVRMGVVSAALNELVVATRAAPGCVGCTVLASLGQRADFDYTEEWETEGHLRAQLRSERFSKLAQLMEGATEPPSVAFELPSGPRGLDYAEEVRSHRGDAP